MRDARRGAALGVNELRLEILRLPLRGLDRVEALLGDRRLLALELALLLLERLLGLEDLVLLGAELRVHLRRGPLQVELRLLDLRLLALDAVLGLLELLELLRLALVLGLGLGEDLLALGLAQCPAGLLREDGLHGLVDQLVNVAGAKDLDLAEALLLEVPERDLGSAPLDDLADIENVLLNVSIHRWHPAAPRNGRSIARRLKAFNQLRRRTHPGGQAKLRPPSTWRCTWKTV